ncbi:unnamed protein product [Peniophora sp. CBMAI 1063]|nr:unnamed protein product [Peniophora sp. CBMAI 1063]
MLLKRGSEAGHEEHIPCHYCSGLARLGYDEHGYIAFTDNPDPDTLSRGQVWSIRESLMLPIAEYLKKYDRELVYNETRSGKSRATTVGTWIKLHGCKEAPRPCIITKGSGKNMRAYLMGTFNGGQFEDLSLCIDMFCVQVDPSSDDLVLNSSEQHVHSTPRWCPAKRQYVCVLPVEHRGRLPAEPPEDIKGFVLDRWVERNGTPGEKGQVYGFSEKQLNRLNVISQARGEQWRQMKKTDKQNAIRSFRGFVTKHLTPPEVALAGKATSQRTRIGLPSLRSRKTVFSRPFGALSTLAEDRPSNIPSHDVHPLASPTKRGFNGRSSSRASARH